MKRTRIPLTGKVVVSAAELEDIEFDRDVAEGRLADLDIKYKRLLFTDGIRAALIGKLQGRINVMAGRIPAPLCPKCGKPKTAGGIQWIDHAECYARKSKGKSQKAKI